MLPPASVVHGYTVEERPLVGLATLSSPSPFDLIELAPTHKDKFQAAITPPSAVVINHTSGLNNFEPLSPTSHPIRRSELQGEGEGVQWQARAIVAPKHFRKSDLVDLQAQNDMHTPWLGSRQLTTTDEVVRRHVTEVKDNGVHQRELVPNDEEVE